MKKFKSVLGETSVSSFRKFDVYKTNLYSEGIKKPLTFALSADIHLSLLDHRDSCERKDFVVQRRLWFPLSEDIFDEILTFPELNKVDYSILLGDVIDFPSDKNLELLKQLNRSSFGPYLYISGNHDFSFPCDTDRPQTCAEYFSRIDSFATDKTGIFAEITPNELKDPIGGFHAVDLGEVIVAGGNNMTAEGRAALIKGLELLKSQNKPILLCVHNPFYSEGEAVKRKEVWLTEHHSGLDSDELSQKVFADDSGIVGIFCGHLHFFYTDWAEGLIPQIIVTSQENKYKENNEEKAPSFWSGIGIVNLLPFSK